MSGDPNERPRAERDEALMSAYLDGIAELTVEERRRVEAKLAAEPALREASEATRALLGRLRALEPEGREPDWAQLERSIHLAVGPAVPRPWWRSWWWALPGALAAATAALLVTWLPLRAVEPGPRPPELGAGSARPSAIAAAEDTVSLWLDGAVVDVDLAATDGFASEVFAAEEPTADEVALLPATDLGWVDGLDEDDLERAERWLAKEKT